jgi:tRNA A-37 threonylcarbamoyl transferase component Bud32
MASKILQQGAEAIILLSKNIITKDRIPKSYRLPELDKQIRKRRTKSEKKLLEKASKIINSPKPIETYEWDKIQMPFIDGKKLSEHLDNFPLTKQKQICKKIGESIAKLHDSDIIHGDLTTSNMILVDNDNKSKNNKFEKQLSKLKKLNLPVNEYAIFGSGPLSIRGIRESEDIDIIVKPKLWDKLTKTYVQQNEELIKIDSIEIYKNWFPQWGDINKLIDDADIFKGIRFVKLKHVLAWKKVYNREKDKKDMQLIKAFIKNSSSLTKSSAKKSGKADFVAINHASTPIIYFIDFGLGFISHKFEDKAVDLHLLKQALEAKHFKHWKKLIEEVFKGYLGRGSRAQDEYKKSKDSKIVLERLKAVEKRGRYKHK